MNKSKDVAVVDGRNYPPLVMLYAEELMSKEVLSLSRSAILVWLALSNRAFNFEGGRRWHYSYDALVDTLKLSRASVGRGIAELKKKGLITSSRTQGINCVCLEKPPSLAGKTYAGERKSRMRDSGKTAHETPGVSSGETLYKENTNSVYTFSATAEEWYAFLLAQLQTTRAYTMESDYLLDLEHLWTHDKEDALQKLENDLRREFMEEEREFILAPEFRSFFKSNEAN